MPTHHKAIWIAGSIVAFVCVWLAFFSGSRKPRPAIVSYNSNISISSIICTLGTNHVYYYGDAFDQILDPVITRLSDSNAYRLRCETTASNTVIWLRFVHPDYGITPPIAPGTWRDLPSPFRAELINTNGTKIPLNALGPRLQHFRRKFLVLAWEFPGFLEAHSGSTIQIQATNGTGTTTLRIL
jgi:hypothetical protein